MLRKCFQLNTVLWLIFVIYSRVGFDFLRLMIRWREVRSRTCLFQSSDSLQYCSGSYGEYKVMRYSRETDRIWNISSVVFGVDTFFWKTWTSHGIPGWSGKRHWEGKKSVAKSRAISLIRNILTLPAVINGVIFSTWWRITVYRHSLLEEVSFVFCISMWKNCLEMSALSLESDNLGYWVLKLIHGWYELA